MTYRKRNDYPLRNLMLSIILIFFTALGCATMARQELAAGVDFIEDSVTATGFQYTSGRLWDRAVESWERQLARYPDHAPLYYNLGLIALKRNDELTASAYFTQSLKRDPAPFYMKALSKLENTAGIGEVFYDRLFDKTGKIRTGCDFAKHGLWPEADSLWEDASEKASNRAMALYNRALARIVLGDKGAALNYIKESIEINPAEKSRQMLLWIEGTELPPFIMPVNENRKRARHDESRKEIQSNTDSRQKSETQEKTAEKDGVRYHYINRNQVPLRQKPSVEGGIIKKLDLGQRVRIISSQTDWIEVLLDSGEEGWIYFRSLTDDPHPLGE